MKNKKLLIGSCIAIAALMAMVVGYFIFSPSDNDQDLQDIRVNIIGKDNKITLKDMKEYFSKNQFMSGTEDPNKYFSETITNPDTVKFFKYLQMHIAAGTFEDHLREVEKYLHSVMDPQKAEEMFVLYTKFCNYEIELTNIMQKWPHPKHADELIRYLQDIHEYRREVFGTQIADAMWGVEVKGQEYDIRKGAIVSDANLYGVEKEKNLSVLKDEMWGLGPDNIEGPPQTDPEKYASYQEKQLIYQRDLQELPANRRLEMIKDFRKEYFSPEQRARLEQVDAELEMDKKKEAVYFAQEKEIMNNPSIADDKKAELIRELQDNTFGEESEVFRRRLNIEKNVRRQSN